MRFTAAAAVLAVLSSSDAASFFKSSPSISRKFGADIWSSSSPESRQNGWFLSTNVRGGATGEFSR